MEFHKLSIIIVSYNCKELLIKTIESIIDKGLTNYEIIIIENGSDGGAKAVSEKYSQVKIGINENNAGFAAANNTGFNISIGEYILLLNPDTVVLPNTVDPMIQFMEANKTCGICGPKILNVDRKHTTNPCYEINPVELISSLFLKRLLRIDRSQQKPQKSCKAAYVHGSCMLIRREVYEVLGGLDETLFMYCEEFEFSNRARIYGWETWYVSDAEVIHFGEGASESGLRWAIPLRWHSALKVYGRYKNRLWMASLRFAGLLNLTVDFIAAISRYLISKEHGNLSERLKGLFTAVLVLLLPVEIGIRIIPIPNRGNIL